MLGHGSLLIEHALAVQLVEGAGDLAPALVERGLKVSNGRIDLGLWDGGGSPEPFFALVRGQSVGVGHAQADAAARREIHRSRGLVEPLDSNRFSVAEPDPVRRIAWLAVAGVAVRQICDLGRGRLGPILSAPLETGHFPVAIDSDHAAKSRHKSNPYQVSEHAGVDERAHASIHWSAA